MSAQVATVLGRVGRAERVLLQDGREAWVLDAADASLARRLARLGRRRLGGFTAARGLLPSRGDAPVLVRAQGRTVDALVRGERLPWREVLACVRDLASALAECERRGWFPGPLGPGQLGLEPEAHVRADALVGAWLGEGTKDRPHSLPSPRWTPPEQSEGAPWDGAANRYVLGLLAYRLIAGAMPFAGESLRDDLGERSEAGAPPFDEAIARELEPGVQSLVLSMLAPRAQDRPANAAAIVAACAALLSPPRAGVASATVAGAAPAAPAAQREVASDRKRAGNPPGPAAARLGLPQLGRRGVWSVAAGLLIAAGALAAPGPRTTPRRTPRAAPLRDTGVSACASCHPSEVAQWKRSVMAHASKSPLFGALESAVEEQVGRSFTCPNGAGVLRRPATDACRDERTGLVVTGTGGEGWCINCHAPGENLRASAPAWSAVRQDGSREPLVDLLARPSLEGISCAVCHQTVGPVGEHGRHTGAYEGNPTWTSPLTGQVFASRPEDLAGTPGIANSGYDLEAGLLLDRARPGDPTPHGHADAAAESYLRSSEFCGACHDVRLFGTDAVGVVQRGEHFKRLRNAYSEWRTWADGERRAGRKPATCQGCHMSRYPGVCVPAPGAAGDADCPSGTRFEARAPGAGGTTHYFTSVDVPLTTSYPDVFADDAALDGAGTPVGLRARRDMMLRHTFRFSIDGARRAGGTLQIPVVVQNVGAGHRVPAGFSQEREIWVEMRVSDARGQTVYEVGHLASPSADLGDKRFLRVTTRDGLEDGLGRPQGVFGADVADGSDVPRWSPPPSLGGTFFRGSGLINFQNGFLRCVRCIGVIDDAGECQPGPGQGFTRADRFDDGGYDIDTGECRSNLSGGHELFETYFPVGSLDAERGVAKAPDAIIDTRSAPPGVPITYTYELPAGGHPAPFHVRATLHFRSFPPYLVRAFADYEARQAARGLRPSGPQVTEDMLRRLDVLDLATAEAELK